MISKGITIKPARGKLGVVLPGMGAVSSYPEHDLFIQQMKLKNTLRYLRGEEQITHLGLEYYD
jgi:hypothetical protein